MLSWEWTHGQRVVLVDTVQLLFCAHSVSYEVQLLGEGLEAVRHSDVGDVGAADVVALRTLPVITGAEPVAFHLQVKEAA